MDTDMTDVGYDIDIDIDAGVEPIAQQQPEQAIEDTVPQKQSIPEAYLEDIVIHEPWPESVNLQGVSDFDPSDPLYYAMEHCQQDPRVKQLRWVSDNSINLEYYSREDAALALSILTHPDVADASSLSAQAPRKAKPYSKKPDSILMVRQTNAGDQKPRGAATRSNYYQRNPDVAGNRQREPGRRPPPKKDLLDYGDEDVGSRERPRRRSNGDESMNGDSGADRRGPRRNGRDTRDDRDSRGRGGRMSHQPASGRLRSEAQPQDVDSYRPGSRSPKEPRFGRLRGRSASPASDEEGDGRFGFAENDANAGRRRYRSRSRSRSRNNNRRRREPSADRWTHDRANYDRAASNTGGGGRWQKDAPLHDTSPMGNHHRSNAIDATGKSRGGGGGGSLLSRMTKDGQPLVPQQKRSLADRITRDHDQDEFGRLRNVDGDPYTSDFSDSARPRRSLADRITRDTDMNIRGQGQRPSQDGINIRGSAERSAGGIHIRGVASGA
ncbi:hypothetical protein EJ02DRAFT_407843 [Clathrospora elynae]|uniref:Uncharacterized protein n=1 Tax=Clathrospora elynae TaxID=706981 RepID=A0A6A5SGF7_9PLEO|nr:hypothetical protein EJ02DRAFT_407843 [Clathrospora elynae]